MRLGQGTEAGIFSGSLAISLGLHLFLAVLVLWGVGFTKPVSPPVLTVSLVAPDSGPPGPGQGPAPAEAQAGKAPSPSAPPTPLKKQAGPPQVKEKPLKRKAPPMARCEPEEAWPAIPQRPTTPPVVRAPATPAPTARPAVSTPSIMTAPGLSRGASGQTAGQSRDGTGSGGGSAASWGPGAGSGEGSGGGGRSLVEAQRHYLSVVRTRILAKREYPSLARQRHEEGVVRLRFTLSCGGALAQGVQMVKPSGFQLLDEQAQHCVLAAAPFPPFPPDLKRDCLTVEVPIVYKLTEFGM